MKTLPGSAVSSNHRSGSIPGLWAVFFKEIADYLNSSRFAILALLVAVTGLASIYSAGMGIREAVSQQNNQFVFLRLFTAAGGSLPYPFIAFVSFLGPLVGLAIGFDAINGEKARNTLSRLLAQPIYRDAVINGKFLAGVAVLGGMLISLGLMVGGIGLMMTGVPPTGEELLRIFFYLLFTLVYIAFWLSLSILLSLVFRQTATSALAGIAIWLFLSVFTGLLAGIVADAIAPVSDSSGVEQQLKNARWEQNLGRFSPSVIYEEITVTLLTPGVRTLGPVLAQQVQGAIPGVLPLSQSLLLVWPHLTALLAATIICFAVSYIIFMRQEIRAG